MTTTKFSRLLALARIDFDGSRSQPLLAAVGVASVVGVVGSLAADAALAGSAHRPAYRPRAFTR